MPGGDVVAAKEIAVGFRQLGGKLTFLISIVMLLTKILCGVGG